jgi:hypothetical protein
MRLRACTGGLLLAATACVHFPERVKIEVDGRTVELRRHGLAGDLPPGRWSSSSDCLSGGYEPAGGKPAQRTMILGPDLLEVTGADGSVLRLYRCGP